MTVRESAWIIAEYLCYAIVIRSIVVYTYRVFLHPLHSYPGPILAKISDWYGASHSLMQSNYRWAIKNHRKYGPVYRQGPNKLAFSSVRALHDIYQNERFFKTHAYLVTQPIPGVFNLFNVLDKRLHRVKRRIIGEGINDKSMRVFEPSMQNHINVFVRELAKDSTNSGSRPINMTERCRRLGMDIIGQLGFGTALNLQTDTKNRFVLDGIKVSMFRINTYIQFPSLKRAGMDLLLYPFILMGQLQYYTLIKDLVKIRSAEDKHARKDLYSFVIDIKDPDTNEGLGPRDIWSEAAFFMPAGGDTTATALTSLFFYLSRYPKCYEKLVQEIRSTFTKQSEIINGSKLSSCRYLRACINEALRMTPPVCGTLWREYPELDQDPTPLVVDGHVIPPGTEVGVNIYAIHHNEKYFPKPYTFKPERWIESEDDPQDSASKSRRELMHDAFTPFSIGSRGCAGKAMAYMEMSLVFAKTLWHLDFKRPTHGSFDDRMGENMIGTSSQSELRINDRMSSSHEGPNLLFTVRDETWQQL